MSQQSKTTLQSAINTQIADNTSGDISAADIRDNLINITDSLLFNTGSQAITGSLTVTGGITGSLLGTASYATQALSASWAPAVASNPFPFTGSAIISGSLGVTGSVGIQNGDITVTPSSPTTKIAITDGFMKNEMTKTSTVIANQASPYNFSLGSYIYDPVSSPFFPTSNAIYSGGTTDLLISSQQKLNIEATSTEITGSLKVTGSTSLNGLMTLQPANPLPSVTNGSIAYSSSGDFYFGSGSAWRKLTL
jgi:phage baseplate assembly protein gpV